MVDGGVGIAGNVNIAGDLSASGSVSFTGDGVFSGVIEVYGGDIRPNRLYTNTIDIKLDPGGNNVLPGSDNADALGVAGTGWSDLFLGDGAVINFDSDDMTITNASNELQISGGDLVVEATNKIGFGGAPSTDYAN